MLVYGRVPRGPLALLKETWAGKREISPDIGKPVEEYLLDLGDKLRKAASYADVHAGKQQAGYFGRFNLRARHKTFNEGDQVIVLAPESEGKLLNKWQGPGTVIKTMSQSSHLVDLGNSGTRHVHANKMRHFVARVHGCSVIDDRDSKFGNVLTLIPVVSSCLSLSQRVEDNKIENLQPDQRQQLRQLFDEFAKRFDDRPRRCDAVVHRIQTTAGFVTRQMRFYRVPDAFKSKVE